MPAGYFPAGAGFAGADPVAEPSPPPKVVRSTDSALFDLATRTVIRDDEGLVKRIHWVDQAVALALGVVLGSLPSSPLLGHTLRRIKRASGPKLVTEVEDAVNQALSDLLKRGDISLLSIGVDTAKRSQIIVAVNYVNLRQVRRASKNPTATLAVAF